MSKEHNSHHFIVPVKYYVGTFIALLFLTYITVEVAKYDFGVFNIYIAMAIALVKASLVCLFFMGLRWDKGFNIMILISSILFMAIFIAFTLGDVLTRKSTDPLEAEVFDLKTPVKVLAPDAKPKADNHH